jgi:hypothetical protein
MVSVALLISSPAGMAGSTKGRIALAIRGAVALATVVPTRKSLDTPCDGAAPSDTAS